MRRIPITSMMFAVLAFAACGQKQDPMAEQPQAVTEESACTPQAIMDVQPVEIATGLSSRILGSGCGDIAADGQVAVVHYTGWLFDADAPDRRGQQFDSSHDRNQHFKFPLGGGRVIKGWDQGVVGMAIGEIRELTIAPELAYGDRAISVIPAGSTLVFEVELAGLEGEPPAATE